MASGAVFSDPQVDDMYAGIVYKRAPAPRTRYDAFGRLLVNTSLSEISIQRSKKRFGSEEGFILLDRVEEKARNMEKMQDELSEIRDLIKVTREESEMLKEKSAMQLQ
ncbi:uncharacterized protein CIMG_05806 [Coccidioides immitis RS]|uniref:Uncharacterized protein n=1 Tax=Coccidioides immitis (strain RS) TaxID=246410 RepID=A0A0E1RX71_COCIM|nr:uncharacterized protein CIMG_05806 [Coccidioides immitis RS]EAS30327.2 hypothetical protein CIMG_05806 [Coccidioides immitis RS]TPX23318.1 hypothetical protein DIZ76_012647 [Coccidioides immitis]